MKQNRDNGCFVIIFKKIPFKIGFAILFFSFWKQNFFYQDLLDNRTVCLILFVIVKSNTQTAFFLMYENLKSSRLLLKQIYITIGFVYINYFGEMLLLIKFNDLSQSYLFDLIELHAIKLL